MACGFPQTFPCPKRPRRYPAILVRTPYGKGAAISRAIIAPFVEHGYAVVVEDVRGRYESEGVFQPLEQEPADGDDTLELDRAPALVAMAKSACWADPIWESCNGKWRR